MLPSSLEVLNYSILGCRSLTRGHSEPGTADRNAAIQDLTPSAFHPFPSGLVGVRPYSAMNSFQSLSSGFLVARLTITIVATDTMTAGIAM